MQAVAMTPVSCAPVKRMRGPLVYRGRFPEAIEAVNRALKGLSSAAAAERASLQAMLASLSLYVSPPDIAWDYLDQAVATAERIGDPSLTGHVIVRKAMAHVHCREPEAALEAGETRAR